MFTWIRALGKLFNISKQITKKIGIAELSFIILLCTILLFFLYQKIYVAGLPLIPAFSYFFNLFSPFYFFIAKMLRLFSKFLSEFHTWTDILLLYLYVSRLTFVKISPYCWIIRLLESALQANQMNALAQITCAHGALAVVGTDTE